MRDNSFDVDAWLRRIGHTGPRAPTLPVLSAIIAAHTSTIPFENIDVLLGRVPKLDPESLQRKLIAEARGGYCFEQNSLLLAGLTALGFAASGLIARVIRGLPADAARPATHMMLRVDLPEGPFLADVGFGNQTPTAPLALRPMLEQQTPHETMRLLPVGGELTLQARLGDEWQNIYRLSPEPKLADDYEVANWFTATHPDSPFTSNLIVARPSGGRTRNTLFNGRLSVRRAGVVAERATLDDAALADALDRLFGLRPPPDDLAKALAVLDREATRGVQHPFFA